MVLGADVYDSKYSSDTHVELSHLSIIQRKTDKCWPTFAQITLPTHLLKKLIQHENDDFAPKCWPTDIPLYTYNYY